MSLLELLKGTWASHIWLLKAPGFLSNIYLHLQEVPTPISYLLLNSCVGLEPHEGLSNPQSLVSLSLRPSAKECWKVWYHECLLIVIQDSLICLFILVSNSEEASTLQWKSHCNCHQSLLSKREGTNERSQYVIPLAICPFQFPLFSL